MRLLISSIILTINFFTCNQVDAKSVKDSDYYDQYKYQIVKQLDCQSIKIDERYLGRKALVKNICFYEVKVGNNKIMTMWHDVDRDLYGFVGDK